MSGTRRWGLTAALFAAALLFLLVAMFTHSALPLFVMWVPLLAVAFLVLGRADPELRQRRLAGQDESSRREDRPEVAGTDQG